MLLTSQIHRRRTVETNLGRRKRKVFWCYLVKLNISTESIGKAHGAGICSPSNDVDALLNQRFAATAPHRDNKDKKLFTCSRKDQKVSHKAIAKKVPDEISKKIQRSHIDLISTFKGAQSSNLTRKIQTPTEGRSNLPSSMLKALKHNIQDVNQLGSAKNKSFKSDKISDYLRNNFFLKNSGVMSKEMADGGISKAVSNNRTTDSILKQLQRNNMTSVERGNKTISKTSLDIISEKDAAKLNIEDLTFIEKKLNSIATTMNKDFEIYDQIKEYVDIIQEENFGEFYEHLKSSQARLIIKNSMVLERWVMFFVFFFYFNQPKAKPIMHHLKELVFLVHRNSISYLKLFSQWIAKYESLEVI